MTNLGRHLKIPYFYSSDKNKHFIQFLQNKYKRINTIFSKTKKY